MFICCNALSAEAIVTVRQPEYIPSDKTLTLADCINLALKSQSSIRQAAAQVQAQSGVVTQAQSRLLPATSVTTSTELAGGSTNGTTQITFSGNQLVYDFGRSTAQLTQARQQRAASIESLTGASADVVLNVKQAYYTLLQDSHIVDVFKENLKSQQAHVAAAQARESAGLAPHSDVLSAQAAAASAQVNLVTAQNNADLGRVNLNTAIGIDIRSPILIAEEAEPEAPVPTVDQAVNLAMERRPEIRRDTNQVLAAQSSVKAASTGNLPAVTTSVSYTPNPRASAFGQQQAWALSMALQWNPFDVGSTSGAVQQAQAQIVSAQETLYTEKQSISSEVIQSRLNIIAAEAQLSSALAEVASAQENLAAATGRYNAGVGILLEVLDAQAALLKAQVDEYSARYGLSIARSQLQHATGGAISEGGHI